MKHTLIAALAFLALPAAVGAQGAKPAGLKRIALSDQFFCEGAAFGDLNNDRKIDVVSGPYFYLGPDFKRRFEYYPPAPVDKHGYSKNFFAFTHDFNGDKWTDILILGFPGEDASWYENPKGKEGHWTRHQVFNGVDNESPTFGDLTGDGKPEIVCHTGGRLGYAAPDWSDPAKPWPFVAISPPGDYQKFTHGLGFGDVNGDGKPDLLEKTGWWEQPKNAKPGDLWQKHAVDFSGAALIPGLHAAGQGGAQMHAFDVDGDGDADVVTSLVAHGWGLAWFEQVKPGDFKPHLIMADTPEKNRYGVKFSQLHAVDCVDMDGDGVKDIVTGKRHWAHGPDGDPEPKAPAVVYWFKTVRTTKGVDFVPHLIDDNSGVGTQVMAADINGDRKGDVVVGNKMGTFVFVSPGGKPAKKDGAEGPLLFNGKNLEGWEGNTDLWKVEKGEIVGKTETGIPRNDFLRSVHVLDDFRLIVKVKLVPNEANSGIQFRSERHGEDSIKGYQADIGAGWWGKLYEEDGRALLWDKSGEEHVKKGEWNTYEILTVGSKTRTALNGKLCVDLDDPQGAPSGIIALQVHSGGPTEVRFKDFQLEVNPEFKMKTVK